MTIQTATGETFPADPEIDAEGVLWLVDAEGVRFQLAVVLQGGWRIVRASPEEQALLDEHGFGSRRMQ
jgi:hypothetical protein